MARTAPPSSAIRRFAPVVVAWLVALACSPAATSPPSKAAAPAPASQAPPDPPSPATIPIGYLPPAAFQWSSYIAEDKGFNAAQAINLDATQLGTPNEAARAVVSGSLGIATFSIDATVRAIEGGGNLVAIGSEISNPAFAIIAQPTLRDYADLRGKSIAVSTPKDGAAVVLRMMMRAKGVGDDEYDFLAVGTTPNRYTALKSGQADAAIMTQPLDFVAVDEGFRLIGRSSEVIQHFMFMSVSANKTWAQENRPAVVRYLKALGAAIDWMYDPANKDEAIEILMARTRSERDAAAKTYTVFIEEGKIVPRHAEIPVQGLEAMLQAMVELGDLPAPAPSTARYIDLSYVQAAKE